MDVGLGADTEHGHKHNPMCAPLQRRSDAGEIQRDGEEDRMLEGAGSQSAGPLNPERWYTTAEFRNAWWFTESIPGSFTRLNAAAYREIASGLPPDAIIVEVGVDQGR